MYMFCLVGSDVGFIMDGVLLFGCIVSIVGFFEVVRLCGVSGNGRNYEFQCEVSSSDIDSNVSRVLVLLWWMEVIVVEVICVMQKIGFVFVKGNFFYKCKRRVCFNNFVVRIVLLIISGLVIFVVVVLIFCEDGMLLGENV